KSIMQADASDVQLALMAPTICERQMDSIWTMDVCGTMLASLSEGLGAIRAEQHKVGKCLDECVYEHLDVRHISSIADNS
ncbi:hypothetical protein Dimus_027098, partial [Dionaea muscipula]